MSISGFLRLFLATALSCTSTNAFAFSRSQEAQWKAELAEAKARARDFEDHLRRNRASDRKRESAAFEVKADRRREDERVESLRRSYVVERASKPDPAVVEEHLERAHLKELAIEEKKYESLRKAYVLSRDHNRLAMRREANIDPAREYDAHSATPIEELNKIHRDKPFLKFNVEKSSGGR